VPHRGRALRSPAFRRLWGAQLVSEMGDWAALIAASALLYYQHHSAVEAGLVFVVGLLPQVGIGQWLSTYADRYSRRGMMLLADALRLVAYLLLGLGGTDLPSPVVLAILFVAACFTEPFNSARSAAILDLVPEDEYESAVYVDSLTQDLTQALGFALGGTLLVLVSPATGLLINAGSFAVSFVLVAGVPSAPRGADEQPPTTAWRTILAAARHLLDHRAIRSLIIVAVLSEAVGTGVDAAVIPFVTDLGPGFGWLTAALLGGVAAVTLAVTALTVRDIDQARAARLILVLVALPLLGIPLLLSGLWWVQAAGLLFASLLSVPLVPAAMVVNPLLPVRLRATCRSVIVGAMVLAQAGIVWAITAQLHHFGVGRTVAVAFVALALLCIPLLASARVSSAAPA
jgi:MFS family permease